MKIELCYSDKWFEDDLPAVPRRGELVEAFGDTLRVREVVWRVRRIILELEHPTKGHKWVGNDDGDVWLCERCGALCISNVPPEHPNFPGSPMVKGWVDECDVVIARGLHGQ